MRSRTILSVTSGVACLATILGIATPVAAQQSITIRAGTILDGKGGVVRNAIVGRNAEEIIHRVEVDGQGAMDAIVGTTSLNAEALGLGGSIGTLAPGMEADLIAGDGDPLSDITTLQRVVFVMKGGNVYRNVAGR
jgi:cytosine/adenosine deaminase-related metal-dependent hydrolase